mgnify:CR=1 FL=1
MILKVFNNYEVCKYIFVYIFVIIYVVNLLQLLVIAVDFVTHHHHYHHPHRRCGGGRRLYPLTNIVVNNIVTLIILIPIIIYSHRRCGGCCRRHRHPHSRHRPYPPNIQPLLFLTVNTTMRSSGTISYELKIT